MSNNDKSLKKLNAQIAKLSKEKEKNEKTPVIKKKDLVRKVKAKKIDEDIEKNKKKKTSSTSTTKKKKIPENVEIKNYKNITVKKKKKKSNNSKTKKEVKKINDNNIIVDEEIKTFSDKTSSEDIKELENSLREIYDKEIITKKHPNKDFFVNEFLNNVNDKINKISDKAKDISKDFVDKAVELSETPVQGKLGKIKNIDVLSIITIFLGIVFVICSLAFIGFIIWICTY